jgi:chromosome segregation ATPase
LRCLQEKAALDAMVEKFRDFIQENDAKKEKALRKAAEEDEAISRLTAEEATWESQIEDAKRKRQLLSDQIRECCILTAALISFEAPQCLSVCPVARLCPPQTRSPPTTRTS